MITYLPFYLDHLYIASFGFIEGFFASFYAISCVFHLLNKQDFSKKRWTVSLLLFAASLGGKAPCGCIVLVGAVTAGLWLLLERKWKSGFYISIFYILVFAIEYLLLFYKPYNAYTANHAARMGFNILKTLTEKNTYYINYHSFLSGFLHNSWLSALVLISIFLFMTNFIINYYVFVSLYIKLKNLIKEKRGFFTKDKFELILWAMFTAAYFCFIIFWQDGYSQVYFVFAAFPYGILISFYYLEKYKPENSVYSSIHSIGLILTGIGIALSLQTISPYAVKGAKNLLGIVYETPSTGCSITRDEKEAMSWIKNNTNDDALFITNKLFCGYMGTHSFITSAYTERQMYLEGYAYESLNGGELEKRLNMVAGYFQGNKNSNELLKNQGIDYAIVFKNVEGYNCPAGNITVFENNSVSVIKINE